VGADRIARIGTVLGGLATNMSHNLLLADGEVAYPERQVASDFLVSAAGKLKIFEWLRTDGLRFLETLDAWMNANQDELKTDSGGQRVSVSLFLCDLLTGFSAGATEQTKDALG
jgi:hypothetical protein